MSEGHSANVEWIIANAINEQARGDPDALAADIIAALEKAGYCITPVDTALGSQPFNELTPDMRPQDAYGDGRDWKFETDEHGGDEPDNMPQAITATDPAGRWAVYVPLTRFGKISSTPAADQRPDQLVPLRPAGPPAAVRYPGVTPDGNRRAPTRIFYF
jgi:hypothetical protein